MDDDDFTARATECWPRLVRTARLLTGDSAEAEGLARAALAEVYARRGRVPRDDAEFCARRALVGGYLRRARGERLPWTLVRPGSKPRFGPKSESKSKSYEIDQLDPLTEVLAALRPRRRAVAVLHHWDGLTHREIAALLKSSPGAVKAHRRRALKALRAHAAYTEPPAAPHLAAHPVPRPVPRPVPLPEIEQAGRIRRRHRRRTTALLTAAGALLVIPAAVGAVRGTASGSDSGSATTPVAATAVRIVTAGERVAVAPGVELWLTKDGKHWSTPKRPNQFHPVDEGKGPATLSLQSDPVDKRHFLSGVYQGAGVPSRAELTTAEGKFSARLLTLAGSPGWSVWYADTQLTDLKRPLKSAAVKIYDSTGKLLAQTGTPS
ncbi:sigma factor-like helix-turn-helix DNA-binding protein [Streptomyces sp. NPDC050704]|uniref:sigma factor-like helix-turn-helix DNA-binding protein n=1 Tax=Streptomyces sp. NPDC050704 TaxID=3157219 RepID=UPI0034191DFC